MLQPTDVADPVTSEYSPSPSPHSMVPNGTTNHIDLFKEESAPPSDNKPSNSTQSDMNANEHSMQSDDGSLHEMVQSILNDSDNDIVLSNLNGLGYNNIQYNTIHSNDNTASSIYTQSQSQLDPHKKQNEQHLASQSAPSLHSKEHIPTQDDKNDTKKATHTKRKYVVEWRTVIFIRHGKSKWNAAESNTIGKVVAAGQGLWEYYKHKKLRQNNIKKQKSDVDIMDAPLSREGIMEALNLCGYLREYVNHQHLTSYGQLFEKTRNNIEDVMKKMDDLRDTQHQLEDILRALDAYKIESLITERPPPDDDTLRLPPPVPVITRHAQINPNTIEETEVTKLYDIDENDIDHKENNDEIEDIIMTPQSSPTLASQTTTTTTSSSGKRYMAQIIDPQSPMSAQYIISILNGDESKCGVVVSNLRRAMSTACICLKDRLQRRPYEKIQILGCLQEIGLNSDTRPLLFSRDHKPNLSKTEKTTPLLKGYKMKELYSQRLSTKYYKGDASDKTAQQRLQEFALWLFAQRKYLQIVSIGHSHWFQSFFKAYLPDSIAEEDLPAKVRTAKIRNCGVVAFRIQKKYVPSKSKRHGRHISFEIAPDSITTLQFYSDNCASTNHEQKREEEEEEEEDAVLSDSLEDEAITVNDTPCLSQSTSTVGGHSTGTFASVKEEQNQQKYDKEDAITNNECLDRPPIPDNKPPPVPPTTLTNGHHTNAAAENDIKEEEKETKSTNFAVSLAKKPKNWMTRAYYKLGGGEKTPNSTQNMEENENVTITKSATVPDYVTQMAWDLQLASADDDTDQNDTDDDEYVQ